jgi:hypothetical protein
MLLRSFWLLLLPNLRLNSDGYSVIAFEKAFSIIRNDLPLIAARSCDVALTLARGKNYSPLI